MTSDWSNLTWNVFLKADQKDIGKYSTLEVLTLLQDSKVSPTDLIWSPSIPDWIEISMLRERIPEITPTLATKRDSIEQGAQRSSNNFVKLLEQALDADLITRTAETASPSQNSEAFAEVGTEADRTARLSSEENCHQDSKRRTGTIANYDTDKRFGFIFVDPKADEAPFKTFFHLSEVANREVLLRSEPVSFELVLDTNDEKKRWRAVKIERINCARLKGAVVEWNETKRFGKIQDESGRIHFVHYTAIQASGPRFLIVGEEVDFIVGKGKEGKDQATAVAVKQSRHSIERIANIDRLLRGDTLYRLAQMAMEEEWDYKRDRNSRSEPQSYPVLENYVIYTLSRIVDEGKLKVVTYDGQQFAFGNTGLATSFQEEIFACFTPIEKPNGTQAWTLHSFVKETDRRIASLSADKKPQLANYFEKPAELIFDTSLDLQLDRPHLIRDNLRRFPEAFQNNETLAANALEGARQAALQRVRRNYKTAIPQFHFGKIQLLLPLCLIEKSRADLALVINRHGDGYFGSTALSLADAYNNARLIARPDREWLEPRESD